MGTAGIGLPNEVIGIDEVAKSRQIHFSVIPAEAGIQSFRGVLDPGVRRGDDRKDFLRVHQSWINLKRGPCQTGTSTAFLTAGRDALW
jgi:hypothetical protein